MLRRGAEWGPRGDKGKVVGVSQPSPGRGGTGTPRESQRVLASESAGNGRKESRRGEAECRGNELTVGLQVSGPVGDMEPTYAPTGAPSLGKDPRQIMADTKKEDNVGCKPWQGQRQGLVDRHSHGGC